MIDDFVVAKEPTEAQNKQKTETFQTPDQVAEVDTVSEPVITVAPEESEIEAAVDEPTDISKTATVGKKKWHWLLDRKRTILAATGLVLILGAGTAAGLSMQHPSQPVVVSSVHKTVKKKVMVAVPIVSTLTGLPVTDASVNQRPVTGVMVENSDAARPQAGLSQAGVVFEAIAEGGVTRFLALFQDQQPTNVGPIRSARPYYEQWALGFDAGYAHVGGSPDGLADIKTWGVRDLDQFYNSGSYHRITTREAPHNVYTGITNLTQLEISKGYTTSTYTGFPRKAELPLKTPTAKTIDLTLSGPDYNAHYDYNTKTNNYDRSEGGAVQTDSNTNAQLSPKVVVALVVPYSQGALDASNAYYSEYSVIGSGVAEVFQDGGVTTGTWTKTSNNSQITLTDAAGKPIALNPGQTWFTAIKTSSGVTYAP